MFVIVILLGFVTYFFLRLWIKRRKLPPGPFPLPLLGNVHQIGYKLLIEKKTFVDALRDWAEEYGPVHTFWFGPLPTVNICNYSTAVDAMVKQGSNFASRTIPYLFNLMRKGRGIVVTNGQHWVEQRRFALHTLRNFGLGRNIIEERIMYEFEIACEKLDKRLEKEGKSIDAHENLELLIGNIINRMLFTERFEKKEEEKFFSLKKEMDAMMEDTSLFDMLIDEWNVNWPFIKQRTANLMKPLNSVLDFIRSQVNERKHAIANGTHVLQGEGDDFVDAFLIQMKKDRESGVATSFDDETLLMSLLDLWFAGQETTITTLEWAFTFLLLNPQVISRVEEELLAVTKGRRPLSIADRPNTPFYNASLTEIHRCAILLPMNLWRDTSEDTRVGSYLIPKGTAITAQISLIMTDEKHFKNRDEFNPDRYFNGNRLEQRVVAFGLGKRSCLGESLAQAELYLVIANFLLRYKISADPLHMPSMKATREMGTVRRPRPYHICFERRQ
ncbi:hypothetical protein V3C99_004246 [Haemonchus contortus]|uniref:Unspecific monooxygenase n=1 Tax=Haemonchus contortus TaxID=6289 RepID=A0A7I5E643_HAECO|nr:Cytochrome P450 domain containing protein [Haemonchus contortus]